MMLRIFKTSQPLSWILITLILFFGRLALFSVFFTEDYLAQSDGGFANLSTQFARWNPWVSHIIASLVVIFSGFYFNKTAQNINLFKGIHYLLFLIFGLFVSFQIEDLVLTPFIITLPLILVSVSIILTQTKGNASLPLVFNAAFLIGFASLGYLPNVIFILLLFLSLLYMNQLKWRQIVITLLGVSISWLFYDVFIFSFSLSTPYFFQIWNGLLNGFSLENYSPFLASGILLFLTILASITYFKSANQFIIKIRKTYFLLFLFLLIGIGINGFLSPNYAYLLHTLLVPISVLFTVFHLETKKWWLSDLVFIGLLVAMGFNYSHFTFF